VALSALTLFFWWCSLLLFEKTVFIFYKVKIGILAGDLAKRGNCMEVHGNAWKCMEIHAVKKH